MSHAVERGAILAPVLRLAGLRVRFRTRAGTADAVGPIDLDVRAGEILALVGESGSGKSVTALACLRLLPDAPACVVDGRVELEGRDILALPEAALRTVRGPGLGLVFQEPLSALDPLARIGGQVAEGLERGLGLTPDAARQRARECLARVGLLDVERVARSYPHELSGGMRQRALIAAAIALRPRVLFADEVTTALDPILRERILDLLCGLAREMSMAVVLITHDLSVAARRADRVAVMYAGRLAEIGPAAAIVAHPAHPYTRALVRSLPRGTSDPTELEVIDGAVPSALAWPSGCRFHPRCCRVDAHCRAAEPNLRASTADRQVACFHPFEEALS